MRDPTRSHGLDAAEGERTVARPIDVRTLADPHAAVAVARRMVDDLEGSALRLLELGDEHLAASVAREADRQRRRADELQRRIAINVTIERARVRGDRSDRLLRTLQSVVENFEVAERAAEQAATERSSRKQGEHTAITMEGIE